MDFARLISSVEFQSDDTFSYLSYRQPTSDPNLSLIPRAKIRGTADDDNGAMHAIA